MIARQSLPNPDLAELYRQKVENLRECLTRDESTRIKAAAQLRALISKVEVYPQELKGAARLKITGDMSAVVGLTGGCKKTAVQVVAEERFGLYSTFWIEIPKMARHRIKRDRPSDL